MLRASSACSISTVGITAQCYARSMAVEGRAGLFRPCPFCGGQLSAQLATIPFVLGKTFTVIEQVPAEVCESCGEPFLHAEATDAVASLLAAAVERLSTAQ